MALLTKQFLGPGTPNAGDMAGSINGPAVALQGSRLSMYLAWTGTPTGTLKLQTSFDGANWVDTPGASLEFTSQPAGGASSLIVNFSNVPGSKWRIVYTRSGGTGVLTGWWTTGDA